MKPKVYGPVCVVCGYAKAWHKTLADGSVTLNAATRAWVGDSRPAICWTPENKYADVYHGNRTPFARLVA